MWNQIESLIRLSKHSLPNEVNPESNPERRNYYRFLYHLISWRRPAVALEIGVESGLASAYMTRAAAEYGGHVIGIDLNGPGRSLENYHFIQGNSTSMEVFSQVRDLVNEFGPIGVVFQDSSHHYQASKEEWRLYSQFLDSQAIWICDDITPSFHDPRIDPPGCDMPKYFSELPGDKRLYTDVLHFGNTQGIIWMT